MTIKPRAHLTAAGGDSQYHFAHFTLEYGVTTARISIEVDAALPTADRSGETYEKLLRQLALVAEAAAMPGVLSLPESE